MGRSDRQPDRDARTGDVPSARGVGAGRHEVGGRVDSEVRERIYRAVRETPGRSLADLASAVDLERSTLRYHVRVLERAETVESRTVLGHRRVYPAPVDESAVAPAAAVASPATDRIVRAVARHEPARVTDLAADVDRATSTVSSHVCELTDAGVLVRERDGRTVRVRLSEETRAFLSDRDAGGGPSRSASRDVSPE